MTSIPGTAYLVIGILTIGISYFINQKTQTNSLTLFMFIGGIFIIIGLIKLAMGEKPKTTRQRTVQHTPPQAHHQESTHRQQHPGHQNIQQQTASIRTTERTAAENPSSDFISVNPRNRVEQYVLEQEVREAGKEVTSQPPIITCSRCKRRQYRIREHCFVCNHKI
ncbi:MAG: hypothetical protein ABIJ21_03730 [Nanoarchaeota archaeon]